MFPARETSYMICTLHHTAPSQHMVKRLGLPALTQAGRPFVDRAKQHAATGSRRRRHSTPQASRCRFPPRQARSTIPPVAGLSNCWPPHPGLLEPGAVSSSSSSPQPSPCP